MSEMIFVPAQGIPDTSRSQADFRIILTPGAHGIKSILRVPAKADSGNAEWLGVLEERIIRQHVII